MGRAAVSIDLSMSERDELEGLARRRRTAQGLARRVQIVLLAATGIENQEIAERLGTSKNTLCTWRRRYAASGLDGLYDEPRPGAPRQIGDDEIAETIRLTLEATPANATRWSLCAGWPSGPAGTSTSRRLRRRGSTRSSASSPT